MMFNSVGIFNMLKNYNTHFLGVLKDDKDLQLKPLEHKTMMSSFQAQG
ncbi:hypothetical protein E5L04_00900 [Helicobacter pylori]|nr:hypothetical protein [Helicobacter pylori]WQY29838.1 hypothetical protein KVJ90_00935 [Helicobacter pylori]WQY31286.1 hypothetical protein KVL25_00925 [Helicobacter pylori]WQY41163.1 hypothetical protein KVL39_00905 [Helicobacter pylori]WRC87808.1 hypothetical protein E5L04_00900 [Helicobacter pylori]